MFRPWLFLSLLLATTASAAASEFSVLTLNLHGYHPTGEAERWSEDRSGKLQKTDSDIFFFTEQELDRGHRRRLDRLARDLNALAPSVVLLQEVAAGGPKTPKTCTEFLAQPPGDGFTLNSAVRLTRRLNSAYNVALACRGNIGWWTDPTTFREQRILKRASRTDFAPVFDFGANPYPHGLIVEGLAVLVRKPWKILDQQIWDLALSPSEPKAIAQLVVIGKENGDWIALVNIHAGHKLRHFEQAVAARKRLADYLAQAHFSGQFLGPVIGGDFNAFLSEISTLPWEASIERGETDRVKAALLALNDDPKYKPWARIENPSSRIDQAVSEFLAFSEQSPKSPALSETLENTSACAPNLLPSALQPACSHPGRIDFIFTDPGLKTSNAAVIYSKNNWNSLDSVSDHPGLYSEFQLGQ